MTTFYPDLITRYKEIVNVNKEKLPEGSSINVQY